MFYLIIFFIASVILTVCFVFDTGASFISFLGGVFLGGLSTCAVALIMVLVSIGFSASSSPDAFEEFTSTYYPQSYNGYYLIKTDELYRFSEKLPEKEHHDADWITMGSSKCEHGLPEGETPKIVITRYKWKNPVAEFFLFNVKPNINCCYLPENSILCTE